MKYKVSELMERAKSIADIDNSKVISYADQLRYLDQTWRGVAQKLIDHGIKYFHSEVTVATGFNPLPGNFYQIDCICTRDGFCLQRFSNGMSEYEPSYEVIGNTLKIHGSVGAQLTLKYWTKPMWLTFPAPKLDVDDIPVVNSTRSYYELKCFYLASSTEIRVYDISQMTDTAVYTVAEGTQILRLFAGKGTLYVVTDSGCSIVSHTGKLLDYKEGTYPVYVDEKDNLYLSEFTADGLHVYDYWHSGDKVIPVSDSITTEMELNTDVIYAFWDRMIMHISGEQNCVDTLTGEFLRFGSWSRLARCIFEGVHAVVCEDTVNWLQAGQWFQTGLDVSNEVTAVLMADNSTGYGVLSTDGTKYYVESFMPDTVLNFPSTLLYDYMAYSLALLYAAKLGIDTSFIRQAIEVAESQFFDSIDNNGGHKTVARTAWSGNWV